MDEIEILEINGEPVQTPEGIKYEVTAPKRKGCLSAMLYTATAVTLVGMGLYSFQNTPERQLESIMDKLDNVQAEFQRTQDPEVIPDDFTLINIEGGHVIYYEHSKFYDLLGEGGCPYVKNDGDVSLKTKKTVVLPSHVSGPHWPVFEPKSK